MNCDSDIEADDLVPQYLVSKAKLLELDRGQGKPDQSTDDEVVHELAVAKLEAKVRKIESDVLFDKFLAEQQWRAQRIELEKQLATAKKEAQSRVEEPSTQDEASLDKESNDDINDEAERIAAEILAETDDDDDIAGLFASLPQNEVDAATGETRTVITAADGTKTFIRDFGKFTGLSPRKALEEACRSR